MDEDASAGRMGQVWNSLKGYIVDHLGISPDAPDKSEPTVSSKAMPKTTVELFSGARVENPADMSNLPAVSFTSTMFPDLQEITPPLPSATKLAVLQTLKENEEREDLKGLGLYVKIKQSGDEALLVSSVPYIRDGVRIIDMGDGKTNPDDSDGMSALLANASKAHAHNPNIVRLGLLS